jgi:hypothetical protein
MLGRRPDPPEKLSDLERAVWRRIVATKPPEWFSADSQQLLVEYCRACVFADQLAEALSKFDESATTLTDPAWLKIRDLQERNARLLSTLATKMRLTQQSRWTHQTAHTAVKNTAQDAGKPWEYGKSDAG